MKKRVIAILLTLCLLLSALFFGSAATDAELEALQSAHPYSNNFYNTWTYTKDGAYSMILTFSEETMVDEAGDYIYILDKNNREVGCYTGSALSGKSVTVLGDTAKIRLESNDTVTAYGFAVENIEVVMKEESLPLTLLKHADGLKTDLSDTAADISGDGKVSVYDAVKALQILGNDQEESAAPYDEANYLKLMDYNIRCANDGFNEITNSSNNIADRAPRLITVINKYQPDLIGLQEAVPAWISALQTNLVDTGTYEMVYKYRAETTATSLEATPILWNAEKFECLDSGYFWLSDTPDVESNTWGGTHFRICNWVKLKVKKTGKEFLYFNTHLTGSLGVQSAELILERAAAMGGFTKYPVFLSGDFNNEPFTDAYNTFATKFIDFNDALGFDWAYTNNGYNAREDSSSSNHIIDYVWYSTDQVIPYEYRVLNEQIGGGYVADHRGLFVEFALV